MFNITIKTADINNAKDICKICTEDLGYPCDDSQVKERLTKLNYEREAVFVAFINQILVGYIHVEKYETLYMEPMANILGLAVKSEYQNNGIGKKLILTAEKWALENNIETMRLNSGSERISAHDFYRNIGYNKEKMQIRFTKKL